MEEEVEQAEEEIEQEEEAEEEESPHVVIVLKAASVGAQGNWKAARLELRPDDDGLFSLSSLKAAVAANSMFKDYDLNDIRERVRLVEYAKFSQPSSRTV